jgi:hypothetical protein
LFYSLSILFPTFQINSGDTVRSDYFVISMMKCQSLEASTNQDDQCHSLECNVSTPQMSSWKAWVKLSKYNPLMVQKFAITPFY